MPGAEHTYSNSGYVLLGEIVARASGRSLADFMAERIFRPLGMSRTVLNDSLGRRIDNEALSYTKAGEGTWAPTNERGNTCVGSNNVYSTVEDLARWDRNFRDQTVGGPHFREQMETRGVLNDGQTLTYAFALEVAQNRGQLTVSHGGTTSGFRSHMMRLPEHRFSAVCLCNSDQGAPVSTVFKTARIVLGEIFTDPPKPQADAAAQATVDQAVLRRYAGKYQLDDGAVITMTQEDRALKGRVTGQDPFGLVPETENRFHIDGAPEIKVSFDAAGGGPASRATCTRTAPNP